MSGPKDLKTGIKLLFKNSDLKTVKERQKLISGLGSFMQNRKFKSKDLQDIFHKSEIERLLDESLYVFNVESNHDYGGREFVEFVAKTGYKDEPTVGEDGKPLLNRPTPVHFAACNEKFYYVGELFKIYDRFDLNYCNEFGLTHFHAACMAGCHGVVEKFLELGQDPNCMAPISSPVPPPLHCALRYEQRRVIELRNGADPNLADRGKVAPLHVICNHCHYADEFAELLFKISDEMGRTVQIDRKNKLNRTPLQLAVTSLSPDLVKVLLDRGAKMSNICFPTMKNPDIKFDEEDIYPHYYILRRLSAIMLIVERFEKKGHKFRPNVALRIRTFFANEGLVEEAALNLDEFAEEVKHLNTCIGDEDSSPKLYDVIRKQPQDAMNLVTYSDCFDFARSRKLWSFSYEFRDACAWHLCEIMVKKFQAWHNTLSYRIS